MFKRIKAFKKIAIYFCIFLFVVFLINYNFFQNQFLGIFKGKKSIYKSASYKPPKIEKQEPNFIKIPILDIQAPVVYVDEENEEVFQKALESGVVHYPGTANLGEVGNIYIFGHSSDYVWKKGEYKTVFANLPNIKLGDEIKISNSEGLVFNYIVKESFSAPANDTHLLSQETSGKKILTLQTSWPLGTALKRWIVRAEMED